MIDVKPGYSKARAADCDDETSHSSSFIPSEGDSNQEESFTPKATAVENLPDVCCRENLALPEEVGQLPPEGDNDGHDQMRESGHCGALRHVHVVDLLEIFWLGDQEKIKGPGSGEVGDDDGPDWETGEDFQPRRGPDGGWCGLHVSDGLLNVELFSR